MKLKEGDFVNIKGMSQIKFNAMLIAAVRNGGRGLQIERGALLPHKNKYLFVDKGMRLNLTNTTHKKMQNKVAINQWLGLISDLKKGDWAWSVHAGWGQVSGKQYQSAYQIIIGGSSYTKKGRRMLEDIYPSLYTYDPIYGTTAPEPEPEPDWIKMPTGTPILVRDSTDWPWEKAFFAVYIEKAEHKFYALNPAQTGLMNWKYGRLPRSESNE